MPFGSFSSLADITYLVCLNNPNSFLDIGIGNGMNGAMVRNYCGFDKRLIGVEVHEPYRNPMWDLYDKVFIETVDSYLDSNNETFDIILMTDVIEHFTFIEGCKVLGRLKGRLNKKGVLLVSTPAVWIEQGSAHGNEYERHLSLWNNKLFEREGFVVVRDGNLCKYGHRMMIAEYINK